MRRIPLEDNVEDILAKVIRGRQLSLDDVALSAGISLSTTRALLSGQFDEAAARALATVLNLGAEALVALGQGAWYPEKVEDIPGLACFNTPYGNMFVNAFLVWDPVTREAAAFDTGSDCGATLETIRNRELRLTRIFLTHTHGDHIADLERLQDNTGAAIFVSPMEPVQGALGVNEGDHWTMGQLTITALSTTGHTRGGTSYYITGLARPLVAVGDAMFAGSMGGGLVSFEDALRNNCEKLMRLPDETVLLPGHGPLSTIGEQRWHNPFFSAV